MFTASDYLVDWRTHKGEPGIGGVTTHAVPEGAGGKAVCGVETSGDGGDPLIEAGHVSCRRCEKYLTRAGVLPLPATEIT